MKRLPIPLWLCLLIPAHAAVYQGTVGARSLILDDEDASFFYADEHLPYPLRPHTAGCPAPQRCYRSENGDTLRLEKTDDGYRGIWRTAAGDTPLQLRPFTPHTDDPLNRLYTREMPYQAALLADTVFTAGETTVFMNKTLQWHREPRSGLTHFTIADGYPAATQTAINAFLRAQALGTLAAYRQCAAALPAAVRHELQYRARPEPTYMDARFVSYRVHEQNNCGAAYPYEGHYGVNYAVAAERGLELEDILWIGQGAPHLLDSDTAADETIREQRAAWLLLTLRRIAPQTMAQPAYPYHARHYLYPYFYLTPQGAYIGPLLPSAAAAHAHPADTVLPYALLDKHPGILGKLSRP